MKKALIGMMVCAFVACLTVSAWSVGSPDEAKALVDKAIVFMKANGKEKAFAEFTNRKGQFTKGDLYIFVIDLNGMTFAHGGNEKLVGKNVIDLKDSDGKFFIKDVIEGAKAKGAGWSDYRWTNPETKTIEKKSTYFKKEGDLVFGCGIYKEG
jgi:signal transduction histidine kinase